MKNQALTDLHSNFQNALGWLAKIPGCESLGRYKRIKESLEFLCKNYDADTKKLTANLPPLELFFTTKEASNLLDIVNFLQSQPKDHLPLSSIRIFVNAPEYPYAEEETHGKSEGRDLQFEFYLGSRMKNVGIEVIDYDDIVIRVAGVKIGFQCKRPSAKKNLKPAFDRAAEQLVDRVESNRIDYGFVALCLDRVCGYETRILHGKSFSEANQIVHKNESEINELLRNNKKISASKKIIGVVCNISFIHMNPSNGQFNCINQMFTDRTFPEIVIPEHDYVYDLVASSLKNGDVNEHN